MKLTFLSALVFGVIALSSAVHFKCDFSNANKWMLNTQRSRWDVQQSIYECEPREGIIENEDDRVVTNVTGDHVYGKSNDDVKSFLMNKRKMVYMPKGLEKFFKNLIILDIYTTGLKEVHKEDLEPFPELKYLSFADNVLETIDFDLFIYNPKLEMILLAGNKIRVINNALNDIPNLSYLTFVGNRCHSGEAKDDRNGVKELIKKINDKCGIDYKEAFEQCSRDFLDYKKNLIHKTQ